MVEVYDSHEQGERVKSWLRENGSAIVMGLLLAFGGLFGFKQWQLWETSQSQQAAAEYEALQVLLREDRSQIAIRYSFPLPFATATLRPSGEMLARALLSPSRVMRRAEPPAASTA